MLFLTLTSLFSTIGFVACAVTSLYFSMVENNYVTSAMFGVLACWWFILMVLFGQAYVRSRK